MHGQSLLKREQADQSHHTPWHTCNRLNSKSSTFFCTFMGNPSKKKQNKNFFNSCLLSKKSQGIYMLRQKFVHGGVVLIHHFRACFDSNLNIPGVRAELVKQTQASMINQVTLRVMN